MDALNGLAMMDPAAMQAERKRAKHAKKKKAKARSAAVAAAEAAAAEEQAGLQVGHQTDSATDDDDDDDDDDETADATAGGGRLVGVTVTSFREVLERQGATLPGRIREWTHTPVRSFSELAGMTVGTAAGLTAGFAAGCQRHIIAAKQAVTDEAAAGAGAGAEAAGPGGEPCAAVDGQDKPAAVGPAADDPAAAAAAAADATSATGPESPAGLLPEPTPIQSAAWGVLLDADPPDLIAVSATGSGKTLAFLVPMIARTGAVAAQATTTESDEDAEARRLRARAAATVTLKARLKEGRCGRREPPNHDVTKLARSGAFDVAPPSRPPSQFTI